MVAVPMEVENGQPMQIDVATPRACQAEPQSSVQAVDPEAVSTWSEEKLLELAASLLAMRTIRHQPRGLRQGSCTTLKKLLQHHKHCHHQWVKRRDPESLQAAVAAARWAWLGPTLLVRAYEGSEQADGEELTPGMRRKISIELAGKRATLAETGAWTELLRMYVRDLLTFEVDARGDGTHTPQQSTTLKADTMHSSDKMDSCNIRAALQILQTSVRAPQNTQTAAEVHSLVAVETDEHEIARIKMQCAAVRQAAAKFVPSPAKLVRRMARGVVLAAEPGPSGWRNADMTAVGRAEGGPAVLREWMGTWTGAMVPRCTAKLWTAATIAPLDCGPKKTEPGQQMPQPCPRKLRPIALAEVLMKLAESCVIEQHIERLHKGVEPTNLEFGTPDAAALIVRIVRGWANDMAVTPKEGQDADVVLPIDLENAHGRAFRSTCLEAARTACRQLAATCAAQCEPCDTRFWQRCDGGWTVDSTTRGGWQGTRAVQVMFVLGLEVALSKSDEMAPSEITRIGLQDDMTFKGSAAALNRSWWTI